MTCHSRAACVYTFGIKAKNVNKQKVHSYKRAQLTQKSLKNAKVKWRVPLKAAPLVTRIAKRQKCAVFAPFWKQGNSIARSRVAVTTAEPRQRTSLVWFCDVTQQRASLIMKTIAYMRAVAAGHGRHVGANMPSLQCYLAISSYKLL